MYIKIIIIIPLNAKKNSLFGIVVVEKSLQKAMDGGEISFTITTEITICHFVSVSQYVRNWSHLLEHVRNHLATNGIIPRVYSSV